MTNNRKIVGTEYRKSGSLQSLKKELAANTNERLTFLEIYETTLEGKRIVAFQIPPAIPGIPKCFPLPSYDLSAMNRVKVTVYGKVLDANYTQLLHANGNLDIQTVFLLDQIQKKQTISLENYHELKKKNLVEGRYPNIFVSFKVANAVGERTRYITNRGLDENICRELVLQALKIQPATMWEILEVLDRGALSAVLTDVQKQRKVSNLLQKMKNENLIHPEGPRNKTRWHINK